MRCVLGTLLLVAACGLGSAAVAAQATLEASAPSAEGTAALSCEPGPLELGQPFQLTLEAHGSVPSATTGVTDVLRLERTARSELRERVEAFAFEADLLEPTWALLESGPTLIQREGTDSAEQGAQLVARRTWTLVALEAGSFDVPVPTGTSPLLPVEEPLVVSGLLDEDEDVARPVAGFLDVPELEAPGAARHFGPVQLTVAGLGILVFAVGGVLLLTRRREGQRARELPPAERLAHLARLATAGSGATPAELTAAHYGLTAVLRRGLAEVHELGRSRRARGLTDAEWAAGLPAELAEVGALLEDCAGVKYAGQSATAWALSERLDRARALLETADGLARGGPR